MESFSFDGFKIVHSDRTMSSVLREKRLVLNLTQAQVAEKAKIKVAQYQKFERGERSIMSCSFRIACRVIRALGMNIDDFYDGKYILGEEVYSSLEGLRYKKTGRLINEDVR